MNLMTSTLEQIIAWVLMASIIAIVMYTLYQLGLVRGKHETRMDIFKIVHKARMKGAITNSQPMTADFVEGHFCALIQILDICEDEWRLKEGREP